MNIDDLYTLLESNMPTWVIAEHYALADDKDTADDAVLDSLVHRLAQEYAQHTVTSFVVDLPKHNPELVAKDLRVRKMAKDRLAKKMGKGCGNTHNVDKGKGNDLDWDSPKYLWQDKYDKRRNPRAHGHAECWPRIMKYDVFTEDVREWEHHVINKQADFIEDNIVDAQYQLQEAIGDAKFYALEVKCLRRDAKEHKSSMKMLSDMHYYESVNDAYYELMFNLIDIEDREDEMLWHLKDAVRNVKMLRKQINDMTYLFGVMVHFLDN